MELDASQKRELYQDGYVVLPQIVPLELVNKALTAINYSLGTQGIDPARLTEFNSQSFCPELRYEPVLSDLVNGSPLLSLAESAIGPGQLAPVNYAQIALRFPRLEEPAAGSPQLAPHLDGLYSPHNGVPKGQILSFTALLGIFLNDVPTDMAGNFTVWPGTHHSYERYFRERGPQALLEGMPPIDLPEPVQLKVRAGDAVLCHYQLGHSVAPHTASPHVRYAIFFRLARLGHNAIRLECLTDIWREWDGIDPQAYLD